MTGQSTSERIAAAAAANVDRAPPLSQSQRDRLRQLLAADPVHRREAA